MLNLKPFMLICVWLFGWYTEAVESLTLGRAKITSHGVCATHTSSTTSYHQFLKLVRWLCFIFFHQMSLWDHYQTAWTSFKSLGFIEGRKTFQKCSDDSEKYCLMPVFTICNKRHRLRKCSIINRVFITTCDFTLDLWPNLSPWPWLLLTAVIINRWVASRSLNRRTRLSFCLVRISGKLSICCRAFWLWGCTTLHNLEDDSLPQHTGNQDTLPDRCSYKQLCAASVSHSTGSSVKPGTNL